MSRFPEARNPAEAVGFRNPSYDIGPRFARRPWGRLPAGIHARRGYRYLSGRGTGPHGCRRRRPKSRTWPETALEAAAAGLGKTLLPTIVADADARLRRYEIDGVSGRLSRDIWLMVHSDQLTLDRIVAATNWVEKSVGISSR